MPKIAKTSSTVRFNPLHPSGHCKYCREIQPGPCQKPGCLLNEAKAAEDFADMTLKEPAERFSARPGPDFADVLSVLSMHTNNNLTAEAKKFNNESKMSHLDNLIFSLIVGKAQSLRGFLFDCGTECKGVDIFERELSTFMHGFGLRQRITKVPIQVIKKLNSLGYTVLSFNDTSDGCLAGIHWDRDDAPNVHYTLHVATGPLEPKSTDFVIQGQRAEGEEEPDDEEEEEDDEDNTLQIITVGTPTIVAGLEAGTALMVNAMNEFQPRYTDHLLFFIDRSHPDQVTLTKSYMTRNGDVVVGVDYHDVDWRHVAYAMLPRKLCARVDCNDLTLYAP
jgi:hypothetical protein